MRNVVLSTLLFLSNLGMSQGLTIDNFGVTDGLQSSEIQDIYCDAKGYVWFATHLGITKYDGDQFVQLSESGHLKDPIVLNFYPETDTRLWFSTASNQLYYFNPLIPEPTIYEYKYNNKLKEVFQKITNGLTIRRVWKNAENRLNMSLDCFPGKIQVDSMGNCTLSEYPSVSYLRSLNDSDTLNILLNQGEDAYVSISERIPGSLKMMVIHNEDSTLLPTLFKYESRGQLGISDLEYTPNKTILTVGKYVIRLQNGEVDFATLQSEGMRFIEYDSSYIIATYTGVQILNLDLEVTGAFLDGHLCTGICTDQENGVWISTLDAGVFYIKDFNTRRFNSPEIDKKIFSDLFYVRDLFYGISWDRRLTIFNKQDSILSTYGQIASHRNYISSIRNPDLVRFIQDETVIQENDVSIMTETYFISEHDEIPKVRAFKNAIFLYDGLTEQANYVDAPFLRDALYWNKDTIYVATDEGLYLFIEGGLQKIKHHNPLLSEKIIKLDQVNNTLLLGTANSGLIAYKPGNREVHNLQAVTQSSEITCLHKYNDSTVYVGTKDGVSRVRLEKGRIFYSTIYPTNNPLSHSITAIEVLDEELAIATKNGTYLTHPNRFDQIENSVPKLIIDSVVVNSKRTFWNEPITVNETDQIYIYFNLLSYRFNNEEYHYKIESEDGSWRKTNGRELIINPSRTGKTDVLISAKIPGSPQRFVHKLTFLVRAPWWGRWYALSIYTVSFFLILYLIFQSLLQRNNRKKQAELDKLKLELKALVAQMNPHFTFNTINSIQHYIIKKDRDEALNYLSEFALLIRMALEFSRRELITLSEELDFLDLYTKLEQKRFDNPFRFKMNLLLNSSKQRILFPPLLLQPIIENAIIHGISGSERKGSIDVIVEEFSTYFTVEIRDNGNGFDTTKENLKTTESVGLEILRQRIQLYNGKQYSFDDLTIESGYEGTLVYIKLVKR